MFNKLLVLTIFAAGCVTADAQQSSVAPAEKRVRTTVLAMPFETSYLGIQTENISKENFTKYGLTTIRGVGIDKIVENSPAAKAGLQKGDVIVKFGGEEVSGVNKLTRLISEIAPEHSAKITILREGSEREISVTLGRRDIPQFQSGNFRFENLAPMPVLPPRTMQTVPFPPMGDSDSNNVFIYRTGANRQIGVGVTPLTKQLGDYFGVSEGKGLLINNVRENSAAARAGLKAGDIIVEIDGREVKTMMDLVRAISEKKEGTIAAVIVRDKNRQTVNVTPETVKPEEVENIFGDSSDRTSDN